MNDSNSKLQKLADAADTVVAQVKLGESAQAIQNGLDDHVNKMFDYAMGMIEKIRNTCDVAEQAIKMKRSDVQTTMVSYVGTLQVVANISEEAQKALGEAMIHGDRLGG